MEKPSASAIEKSVAGNKTRDKVFAIVGLLCTFIGMLTLAALLFDLSSDGLVWDPSSEIEERPPIR